MKNNWDIVFLFVILTSYFVGGFYLISLLDSTIKSLGSH